MTPEAARDEILAFWFGGWDDTVPLDPDDEDVRRWFGGVPANDAEVRTRFAGVHGAVAAGRFDAWEETARGALAKVIVLDQLSRMLYRGSGRAFAWDHEARATTQRALERAFDRELAPIERVFLYMPLMHAEDRAVHRRALLLFTDLAEEAEEAGVARADWYRRTVAEEVRHKEIIDRFGRYPHRNVPLERTSTPEELAFLAEDDEGF